VHMCVKTCFGLCINRICSEQYFYLEVSVLNGNLFETEECSNPAIFCYEVLLYYITGKL
jgi:hypothetical protein